MKKLIVSALFVTAFSAGLFAKQTVDAPVIEKEALELSQTKDSRIFEEDVQCVSTSLPICDGGDAVGYFSATVCASDVYAFIDSFDCETE